MTPSKSPLPILGTWKLTSCESSRPDLPHPVSGITVFTQEGNTIHYSNDGVWSNGRISTASAVLELGDNWYPISGSLLADSLSLRLLPDGSYEARGRKGEIDVLTLHSSISADGRTMTGEWHVAGVGEEAITWRTTSERLASIETNLDTCVRKAP